MPRTQSRYSASDRFVEIVIGAVCLVLAYSLVSLVLGV